MDLFGLVFMDKRLPPNLQKSMHLEISICKVINVLRVWLFVLYSKIEAFIYNAITACDILYIHTCTC